MYTDGGRREINLEPRNFDRLRVTNVVRLVKYVNEPVLDCSTSLQFTNVVDPQK